MFFADENNFFYDSPPEGLSSNANFAKDAYYIFSSVKIPIIISFHYLQLGKKCPYSVLFWSAFYPHFPTFGLNKERYSLRCALPETQFIVVVCFIFSFVNN